VDGAAADDQGLTGRGGVRALCRINRQNRCV
jgi:hypothetical protein